MFKHGLDQNVSFRTAFNWFLLTFLSGTVNAGGVLACHRFVTHITGFATLSGIDFARQNWHSAIGLLSVPLYYLLGTIIAAFLVDRRLHQEQTPRYALVMSLVTLCFLAVALGGIAGYFGPFGGVVMIKRNYLLMILLCMASGLQNAAITTASRHTVRSSHLTGPITDFGIGLVRAFFVDNDPERQRHAIRTNWLRLGSLLSFILGSGVGALIFMRFQYYGFFLPALLAIYAVFQDFQPKYYLELERVALRLGERLGLTESK